MHVDVPTEVLIGLLMATVRTASWLLLAPPFSHRAIPAPVKALLAIGLGLAVLPDLPDSMRSGLDAGVLAVATAQEVLVGSGLGFLCMVVFAAVKAAGDLLDMFGGFTMAFSVDPQTGGSGSVLGRTYQLTALALLFASNAHLLVLGGLLRTFDVLPVGQLLDLGTLARTLTGAASGMFLAALQIAGPLIAVLFLADVGLGLLTRVAPALNAFILGFPLKILITLVIVALGFSALPHVVDGLADDAARLLVGVVRS
ncbi:MAG TPA: flagellar biosynthetic protein FliR [Actinomycetales bacterium]|nr:flagellar biosynthetic protein FliR [Actinomycetales bacterium]